MSNRPFQPQGQQPTRTKIQVQCVNCRARQWINGPEALNEVSSVRWDCRHCHFNNQASQPKKAEG